MLEGVRVLLVEDDVDSLDLFALSLSQHGAEVVPARSVAEALTEFERSPPDVLVSDLGMAGLDGHDLIRAVRALGVGRGSVPAVALTAWASQKDRDEALAAGFDRHVTKPCELATLVEAVADLLGRSGQG